MSENEVEDPEIDRDKEEIKSPSPRALKEAMLIQDQLDSIK